MALLRSCPHVTGAAEEPLRPTIAGIEEAKAFGGRRASDHTTGSSRRVRTLWVLNEAKRPMSRRKDGKIVADSQFAAEAPQICLRLSFNPLLAILASNFG